MNMEYRKQLVLAMEFIVRHINDTEVFMKWLTCGVPDGDITFNNLTDTQEVDEYFTEDANLAELMDLFLKIMQDTLENGGLYCDRVSSKEKDYD